MLRSISGRSGIDRNLPEVLADPVVDDDLVGDRVADQGQQRRHRIEVELDLRDGEEPDRLGHVEDQSDDDPDPELPFEPKPDVKEHRNERESGRQQAVAKQLAAHPRADDLDAPDLHIGQRRRDSGREQPLRVLELGLVVEADQNILGRAEFLHPEVAKAQWCKGLADRVGRKRMGAAQFDHDPAAKIDAEI